MTHVILLHVTKLYRDSGSVLSRISLAVGLHKPLSLIEAAPIAGCDSYRELLQNHCEPFLIEGAKFASCRG